MPTIDHAISAYATAVKRATSPNDGAAADAADGPSFGSMVKDAVGGAIDAGRKSEAASRKAVSGKADIAEVAQAINNADVTLQTVVAVRDKVVQAYQQILSMPI
jgi:flagellar hook-basal body complex protein FliE